MTAGPKVHDPTRIEDLCFLDEQDAGLPEALARLGWARNAENLEKFCARWGISAIYQRMKHRGHVCSGPCPDSLPPRPPMPPPLETTMTDDITTLIAEAQDHTSKRIQAAAKRADEAVEKLRDLLAAEEAKAEAQAEVDRLERELRQAKARARGQQAPVTPKPTATRVDTKKIRAWAHAEGMYCPDRGRVPQQVVDAYDAAHREAS